MVRIIYVFRQFICTQGADFFISNLYLTIEIDGIFAIDHNSKYGQYANKEEKKDQELNIPNCTT